MKILHIAPIGHHSEGIGSVLQKIVPEQIALNNDVKIISIYENVTYQDLKIIKCTNYFHFYKFLKKWKPDIAIFHSHFQYEYVLFSFILRYLKVPYCVQLHGALSRVNYNKDKFKKYIASKLCFNSILKSASCIFYLNKSEYLNSIVPLINDKSEIIPNGCDIPTNLSINVLPHNPVRIIFIGRILFVHKGIDLLLKALLRLESKYNTLFHVYFYGNTDDIDVEHLKDKLKCVKIASYEGGIYGRDKDTLLRNSDIFVLTSRYEGMPMGVLEAWSYGIPCILTRNTNMINEDTEQYSYWEAELDDISISETLIKAVTDFISSAIKYKEASINESSKYQWKNIATKSLNDYHRIIKNKK